MKLYIKNMVCSRCIMVVKEVLHQSGLDFESVELGEVELKNPIKEKEKQKLNNTLVSYGFSIIDDKKSKIIEKIKNLIIDLVHYKNNEIQINLSAYLSQNLQKDYTYLSHLFTEVENQTIEHYFIAQKIERVKELLVYDEYSLSEIAYQLQYSSVSHLSKQFKKHTGFSPSHYKQLKENKRTPLEEV